MTSNEPQSRATSALVNTYATYPFSLTSAKGEFVYDDKGQQYLDLYGGHCVCATGHSHPHVMESMRKQMDELFFYSNAAPMAVREHAARKLVDFAGAGMVSAFFCNSGSEANENALKAATLLTGRKRFLAFHGSFHGRTMLALSVTDSQKLTAPFKHLVADVSFLPFGDTASLEQLDLSDIAAVILEPIQSMAGVRVADKQWLQLLREKCTAAGTLLIFDEVQTGMARLGTPFAANYFSVEPDLITLAKSIASGFPMGAVLFSKNTSDNIKLGDFGSTFGGGPVACAALIATLEVIEQEGLAQRASTCHQAITEALAGSVVSEVVGAGLLLGLNAGSNAGALKQHLLANHILVGGSNDPSVLRLMPPLTISDEAIATFVEAVNSFELATGGGTK